MYQIQVLRSSSHPCAPLGLRRHGVVRLSSATVYSSPSAARSAVAKFNALAVKAHADNVLAAGREFPARDFEVEIIRARRMELA